MNGSGWSDATETRRDTARAMSEENLEALRRLIDAFNRRDEDAAIALMDGEVEAVPQMAVMEGVGVYRGHDGFRRWWSTLLDTLPDYKVEVLAVRERGNVTIAALRGRAHGRGSEAEIEQRQWHAARWRNGKVVWWSNHPTEAEALEAVGRSE
jgi:ketosteroid isomerase-like protein